MPRFSRARKRMNHGAGMEGEVGFPSLVPVSVPRDLRILIYLLKHETQFPSATNAAAVARVV